MELLNLTIHRRSKNLARRVWISLVMSALLFFSALHLPAQTATSKENQVKALFLYSFSQFVEWPAEAFPDPQMPLVIAILGDDPFGAYLDEIVRGEKVHNRPLLVQRVYRVADIRTCHILFVSQSESNRLEQILGNLKDRPILTVGEVGSFTQRGGMIRFFTDRNKVRFEVNQESARAASLTISSKLIRTAE